jgi:hypothetical protein
LEGRPRSLPRRRRPQADLRQLVEQALPAVMSATGRPTDSPRHRAAKRRGDLAVIASPPERFLHCARNDQEVLVRTAVCISCDVGYRRIYSTSFDIKRRAGSARRLVTSSSLSTSQTYRSQPRSKG